MDLTSIINPYRANWVKVDGQKYCQAVTVIIRIEKEFPVFGVIQDVYVLDSNNIALYVKVFKSLYYSSHFHGYAVEDTKQTEVITVTDCSDYQCLCLRKVKLNTVVQNLVVLKYHICGT